MLLETILVPTHWASIILVKNSNMPCIYLLSPAHYLYMDTILEVYPCVHVKSSLHLIWNLVWHLCSMGEARHTILFISWIWRLTITHHIMRVDVSLIRGATKLSPYTHRFKTSKSNSLLYGSIVHYFPLYGFPIAPMPRPTLL